MKSKIYIYLVLLFGLSACNVLEKTHNRGISTCSFYSDYGKGYAYFLDYKFKRYTSDAYGTRFMIPYEDKFAVLFDSLSPEEFYPLYFCPILDSNAEYDTTNAMIHENSTHYIPLYNEKFYDLRFHFSYKDDSGNLTTVNRGQILRRSLFTKFIDSLKEDTQIKIIYNINNPSLCYIKIRDYYLFDHKKYINWKGAVKEEW